MKKENFVRKLITFTEKVVTFRQRRKFRKKEKQKQKHVVRDWVESFLWAAMVVLLINQYLIQAYRVPTGSMIDTILPTDQLFVNKLVYGPELVPGKWKLPGFSRPQRTDVMIFQTPEYQSKGAWFDISQRIIYMLTLSLIDINHGEPQFLIKRLVCVDGDIAKFIDGNLYIKPRGEADYIPEEEFKEMSGLEYGNNRLFGEEIMQAIKNKAVGDAYHNLYQLPLTPEQQDAQIRFHTDDGINTIADHYDYLYYYFQTKYSVEAEDAFSQQSYFQREMGHYVPMDWGMPLGDNRDNSKDGRYWGPIPKDKILGRAMFIYWKPQRIGAIR